MQQTRNPHLQINANIPHSDTPHRHDQQLKATVFQIKLWQS